MATWSVSMNTTGPALHTTLQNSICSLIQLKGFNLFDHNVQGVVLSHCAPLLLIHAHCHMSHVTLQARDADQALSLKTQLRVCSDLDGKKRVHQ